jgi:hypothetical protein
MPLEAPVMRTTESLIFFGIRTSWIVNVYDKHTHFYIAKNEHMGFIDTGYGQ